MKKICTNCGAAISGQAAVCPHCGKVAERAPSRSPQPQRRPASGQPQRQQGQQKRRPAQQRRPQQGARRAPYAQTRQRTAPVRPAPAPRPAVHQPVYVEPEPVKKAKVRSPKHDLIMRRVYQALTVAVIVTALYLIIYMVQVFRVRSSEYKFDGLNIKLSHSSYGTAFKDYFEDTHWYVNPFNMKVTFKGESKHKEQYKIVFTARAKVKLKAIEIDERVIDEKLFGEKMMGIFM